MKNLTPLLVLVLSGIFALLFKVFSVDPAYEKLPNGNYGEMFGPISYLKDFIYGALLVAGIVSIYFLIRQKRAR